MRARAAAIGRTRARTEQTGLPRRSPALRLLAHELEHVAQQRRLGARLQLQSDAGAPDPIAGVGSAPADATRRVGDTIVFQGVPLAADEDRLYEPLVELVTAHGDSALRPFVAAFEEQVARDDNDAHPSAGSPPEALQAADRLNTERSIVAPLKRTAAKVQQEDAEILAGFEVARTRSCG